MILTLSAYALLAVLPPTVWVWARLRYERNMRSRISVQLTCQVPARTEQFDVRVSLDRSRCNVLASLEAGR